MFRKHKELASSEVIHWQFWMVYSASFKDVKNYFTSWVPVVFEWFIRTINSHTRKESTEAHVNWIDNARAVICSLPYRKPCASSLFQKFPIFWSFQCFPGKAGDYRERNFSFYSLLVIPRPGVRFLPKNADFTNLNCDVYCHRPAFILT